MIKDIDYYLNIDYTIIHESKNYVTLERPKKFSIIALLLWTFLGFGIGALVYIAYYLLIPKRQVTLIKC